MNRLTRKNGKKNDLSAFTLVELLSVIVIIGLLLGITYPSISKYINETRETDYTLHEENMRLAATNLMSDFITSGDSSYLPSYNSSKIIYLKDLIEMNYSSRLKDPEITSEYCSEEDSYVEIINNGSSYTNLSYNVCLVCSNYSSSICNDSVVSSETCDGDNSNPVCGEATGASTLWTNEDRIISVGCGDLECGCSKENYYKKFSDNMDVGSITIEDKAGNTTKCSVNVYVDKEKPNCELQITGTIGSNGWYGKSAPIISFKEMSDNLSGIASFGLGTSSSDYDFNKSDSYTVNSGITTVYGYVKDNAGNVGYCSIEVKYDNAKPTQDTYYGYQVYTKDDISTTSSKYITLDSDTALGVSSSNILSEYGSIYGLYIYPNSSNKGMKVTVYNGKAVLKSITISSGITTPVYIQFDSIFSGNSLKIEVTDTSGNNSRVSYISKIEVATKSSYTASSEFYTNQNVTLYIYAKDSLSGKAVYSFDGGNTWQDTYYKSYTANTGNLTLYTKDIAGNISDGSSMNINNIDKVNPECEIIKDGDIGSNSWYTGNVNLTLSYSDSGGSDIRYYDLTTSSSITYGKKTSATQTDDTSGTKWYGYVIDKAGNESSCNITVKKDTTKPNCTLTSTSSLNKTSQSATLSCTDTISGLNKYYWGTTSGSTPNTAINGDLSKEETISSKGTYYLIVTDKAGNKATKKKTYYTYKVYNMLQLVNGTADIYNTNNYDTSSTSKTYLAPSGTTLTTSNVYSKPTESVYKGYSIGKPSTTKETLTTSGSISLTGNITIAYWFNRNSYTLTYDSEGGDSCSSVSKLYGDTWGTLCSPTKSGYLFKGWYTKKDGEGDKITKDSKVTKDQKVYAYWVSSTPTVTFNYTSGYVCPSDGEGENTRKKRNEDCHEGKYYNRMKITDASYDKTTGVITFKYDLCMNDYSVSWEADGYVELCIAKVGSTKCVSGSLASWKPDDNSWLSIKTCQGAKTVTVDVSSYDEGSYKVIAVGSESFAFSKKDYTDITFFTISK